MGGGFRFDPRLRALIDYLQSSVKIQQTKLSP